MKPCRKNRKLIAWLALGALKEPQARALRSHIESCPHCRGYLEQLLQVTEKVVTANSSSELIASETFHRRVVGRLRAEKCASSWRTTLAYWRGLLLAWRATLAGAGATAVVITALVMLLRHPGAPVPGPIAHLPPQTPKAAADVSPTISNYEKAANHSLDSLDDLLTRQGTKSPRTSPIYRVSGLSLMNGPE